VKTLGENWGKCKLEKEKLVEERKQKDGAHKMENAELKGQIVRLKTHIQLQEIKAEEIHEKETGQLKVEVWKLKQDVLRLEQEIKIREKQIRDANSEKEERKSSSSNLGDNTFSCDTGCSKSGFGYSKSENKFMRWNSFQKDIKEMTPFFTYHNLFGKRQR